MASKQLVLLFATAVAAGVFVSAQPDVLNLQTRILSYQAIGNPGFLLGQITNNIYPLDSDNVDAELPDGQLGQIVTPPPEGTAIFSLANVAYAVINIAPCSMLLPHTHPRGTETDYVVKGNVTTYLVYDQTTLFPGLNNANYFSEVARPGQVVIFPQGLLHALANFDCETAKVFVSFTDSEPGLQFYPPSQYLLPEEILVALQYAETDVQAWQAQVDTATFTGFVPLTEELCGCTTSESS